MLLFTTLRRAPRLARGMTTIDDPFRALSPALRLATGRLAAALDAAAVPYAVAGAVACNVHGHSRATVDVDVLVARDDVSRLGDAIRGVGWSPRYRDARRSWRDTIAGVDVDVLMSGDFPGDGRPKPVSFPSVDEACGGQGRTWVSVDLPADAGGAAGSRVRVLSLVPLISVKLASAASAAHRRKDAADVGALIAANALPREFACELDITVRELFLQLWDEHAHAARTGVL